MFRYGRCRNNFNIISVTQSSSKLKTIFINSRNANTVGLQIDYDGLYKNKLTKRDIYYAYFRIGQVKCGLADPVEIVLRQKLDQAMLEPPTVAKTHIYLNEMEYVKQP